VTSGEQERRVPVLDLGAQYRELKAEIDAAVARVIDASAFIGGIEVEAFEQEFAGYLGVRHAVGVGNGTDALELALQAAGVGPGDIVVTTPFTFVAPLEAIIRAGARPLLADIRPDDYTIDTDGLEPLFARNRIKAVIPVHLFGHAADLDSLLPLARAHGAVVIEDAAQAHGAWYTVNGSRKRAGSVGDAACFSFYPTKNLGAMGDGGAVVTDDDELARRVRLLANHGEAGKYRHVVATGRNSRLDALQAAILRVKLRHLDTDNAARRAVAAHYAALLRELPLLLPHEREGTEAVYHQYVIRVARRDEVRAALAARGIGTALHYPLPLHRQPGFRHLDFGSAAFPVAEQCAEEVLSLPMFPQLTEPQIPYVAETLRDVLMEAFDSVMLS
jgi:dTDP-4-amino-4,6-dideoxygalactose transaminase